MKYINLYNVKISDSFLKSKPSAKKLMKAIKYFEKYGRIDKPIVLNNGVLVDGYIRYLVADIKGLEKVPYVELQQMSYIVGVFDGNKKEYTWKNNKRIPIDIGDKVCVKVKGKDGKIQKPHVTVIDIFSSDSLELYRKHNSVVKKYLK